MKCTAGLIAASALWVGSVNPVEASLAFSSGQTAFTVEPGATFDVPIFIREFGPSHEISGDAGLFSAGFSLRQIAPFPTSAAVISNIVSNVSLFDVINTGIYGDDAAALFIDQSGGTIPIAAMPSGGLLLIGTVTLQALAAAGQTTAFSIGDLDPLTTQVITYNATELDAAIQSASFTVTTTPTPEPALAGPLVAIIYVFAKRRCLTR